MNESNLKENLTDKFVGSFRKISFPTPSPLARFWIAVVIVVVGGVVAFTQSPRPDALRPPPWLISTAWWRYPLEWNAANRLPKIECSLNAIQALPNSTSIWAVGNKGMVANSADGGKTWIKKGLGTTQVRLEASPAPSVSPAASPSPTPPPTTQSFLDWPDLIPSASAAQLREGQVPAPSSTPTPALDDAARELLEIENRFRSSQPTPDARRNGAASARQQGAGAPAASAFPTPLAGSGITATVLTQPSPEVEQLIAVRFVDDNQGEAVGNWGSRYVTSDSGNSWTRRLLTQFFAAADGAEFILEEGPLRSLYLGPRSDQDLIYLPDQGQTTDFCAVTSSGRMFDVTKSRFELVANGPVQEFNAFYVLKREPRLGAVTTQYVWATAPGGIIYRSLNLSTWEKFRTPTVDDLYGVFFIDENRGWVTGSNGAILTTSDGGTTWSKQTSGTTAQLNAVNFLPDGRYGWIAGSNGLILSTDDGGATWVHRTQGREATGRYLKFPAPWFFLGLCLAALLVWRRPKASDAPPEESVADVLVSDRPIEEAAGDVLAFNAIARGLSRFLRNENTLPPLTIAITGQWGTGKSSLMNLLRADLRAYKFRPIWFNAWHHQKEEHMLASLLENIKLQAVPRWWNTRGLLFRARLLGIRGVRHWLPVLLLAFFIYVVGVYYYYAPAAFANTLKLPLTLVDVVAVLPILAGVVTFVGAVWRGITAFGVKPASLLAGVSNSVSIRGLEAQTSFRQKFAEQFNDVTRALGSRSLLIFIDDLDRCRPENVLETLEAINFLTTSGECFVVIGMAREYVERCVGRAFNEVAQEMVDDLQNDVKESAEGIAREKRIEFARQYLDKLVNIEVPVPAPRQSQSLALLVASTRDAEPGRPLGRWSEFRLALVRLVEERWRVVPVLLITGAVLVLGYYLARGLVGAPPAQPNDDSLAATGTATPQPTLAPTPIARLTPSRNPTPIPTATPTPTPDTERSIVVSGSRAIFSPGVLPLLALVALSWLGFTILTRKPGLVVKDSPRFVEALEIWHPLVFARQGTPRATKRFMNFVRYLAMRQRQQNDSQSPIKQFLASLKDTLTGIKTSEQVNADAVTAESGARQIPDEVLVALAALQHLNPECLGDQPGPASSPEEVWPRAISATNPLRPLFEKAREDHEAKFGNWAMLNQYRERFLEMTANVQVR